VLPAAASTTGRESTTAPFTTSSIVSSSASAACSSTAAVACAGDASSTWLPASSAVERQAQEGERAGRDRAAPRGQRLAPRARRQRTVRQRPGARETEAGEAREARAIRAAGLRDAHARREQLEHHLAPVRRRRGDHGDLVGDDHGLDELHVAEHGVHRGEQRVERAQARRRGHEAHEPRHVRHRQVLRRIEEARVRRHRRRAELRAPVVSIRMVEPGGPHGVRVAADGARLREEVLRHGRHELTGAVALQAEARHLGAGLLDEHPARDARLVRADAEADQVAPLRAVEARGLDAVLQHAERRRERIAQAGDATHEGRERELRALPDQDVGDVQVLGVHAREDLLERMERLVAVLNVLVCVTAVPARGRLRGGDIDRLELAGRSGSERHGGAS
jgi:hypothetical protein